jgi:hypothetical protein
MRSAPDRSIAALAGCLPNAPCRGGIVPDFRTREGATRDANWRDRDHLGRAGVRRSKPVPLIDRIRQRIARNLAPFIGSELAPHIIREIEARVAAGIGNMPQRLETVDHRISVATAALSERASTLAGRSEELATRLDLLSDKHAAQLAFQFEIYRPTPVVTASVCKEYMQTSNPVARDFFCPEFKTFCELYGWPVQLSRTLWEHAFIYEHLNRSGVLAPGKRGLGFGVGGEVLPAIFANLGVDVTATDAPDDAQGWGPHHSSSVEKLFHAHAVSRENFEQRVRFQACDMNAIPSHLSGYDFCWSCCALEHLGSIQRGIDFIINSVETLKVGGVACHTTEFNLSSDEVTFESPALSLYRKSDLERLRATLIERGHSAEPLRVELGNLPPDYLIDMPPFHPDLHLKVLCGEFVMTSIGIVARRGR